MNGKQAIKAIAKREGKSVSEIRKSIKVAIAEAYNNPFTRGQWDELFGEGVIPTPEEFLCVMVEVMRNK